MGARQSLRPAGGRRRILLEDRAPRTTPPSSRIFYIAPCGAAAPRLSPTTHAPPPLIKRSSRATQFEIAPGALELFSFKGDKDDLANSEKLKGHALKVTPPPRANVNQTAFEQHRLIIHIYYSHVSHHIHHLLRRQVMTTVGVAVAGLKDLGALVPVLEGLGAKHKPCANALLHRATATITTYSTATSTFSCCRYGVIAAHYDIVGQALLATLESALGDAWTPPVKEVRRRRRPPAALTARRSAPSPRVALSRAALLCRRRRGPPSTASSARR